MFKTTLGLVVIAGLAVPIWVVHPPIGMALFIFAVIGASIAVQFS